MQRIQKFKFGLGSLFIAVFVFASALAWYVSTLPVKIPIIDLMEFESISSVRTDYLTEYRNSQMFQDVKDAHEERTEAIRKRLAGSLAHRNPKVVNTIDVKDNSPNNDDDATSPFIIWVNQNIAVSQQASKNKVARWLSEERWITDANKVEDFHRFWFEVAALVNTDRATIIEWELYGYDELFAEIIELAGSKFRLDAYEFTEDYRPHHHRLRMTINDRLFVLDLDYSCTWYEVVFACEILNTIASRIGVEERYFVFPGNFGKSGDYLVLFAHPNVVKDLKQQSVLVPIPPRTAIMQ